MMKWTFALHAALGGLLVVPAVLQGQDAGGVQPSLERTIRGIEELAGLSRRLESGDHGAIDALRRATEPQGSDPRIDEERLAALRRAVSELQMIKDGLVTADGEPLVPAVMDAHAPTATATRPFEGAGYCADPLRQGIACLHAGRDAQALELLKRAGDDARASYWSGRALEKLERFDEAAAAYRRASTAKDAGWVAERALAELDVLAWKKARANAMEPKSP